MNDLLTRIEGLADWFDSRAANIFLSRRVLEKEGRWDTEHGKAIAFKSVGKTLRELVREYNWILSLEESNEQEE